MKSLFGNARSSEARYYISNTGPGRDWYKCKSSVRNRSPGQEMAPANRAYRRMDRLNFCVFFSPNETVSRPRIQDTATACHCARSRGGEARASRDPLQYPRFRRMLSKKLFSNFCPGFTTMVQEKIAPSVHNAAWTSRYIIIPQALWRRLICDCGMHIYCLLTQLSEFAEQLLIANYPRESPARQETEVRAKSDIAQCIKISRVMRGGISLSKKVTFSHRVHVDTGSLCKKSRFFLQNFRSFTSLCRNDNFIMNRRSPNDVK